MPEKKLVGNGNEAINGAHTMLVNCKGYLITNHIHFCRVPMASSFKSPYLRTHLQAQCHVLPCGALCFRLQFRCRFRQRIMQMVYQLTSQIRQHSIWSISTAKLNLQNSIFANLLWHMIGNQLQCAVAWIHLEVTHDPIVTTQVRHACSCCGISKLWCCQKTVKDLLSFKSISITYLE